MVPNMDFSRLTTICGIILCLAIQVRTSPTAQTTLGQVVGKRVQFSGHEINRYLGVPYAQPPVGPLRFKRTVPLLNYTSTIKAFKNPPACPQYSENPYPWYVNISDKSEDCLYMNIWTPADASITNKKAVLFWMHGGGFRYGSLRDELFDGVPLVSLGDIVVVTLNYRTGPFGFLTSGTDDAPGNAGLWDLLEGLKWVNKNIESFGGDSSRITISGESAGSVTSGLFTVSPLSRGLYTRLIMLGGSPSARMINDNKANLRFGQQLAESVKCANDTFTLETHPKEIVQCLRNVDAVTLSKKDFPLAPHFSASFIPQVGDEILPNNPRTSIQNGDFECVDLMIGNNKDEASFFVSTSNPDLYGFFGHKDPFINRTIAESTIRIPLGTFPDPDPIVDYYLPANLTDDSDHQMRYQTYTAVGDLTLFCPSVYYAEKCAEQGQNVYYFLFTHRPSVTPWAEWIGTTHYEEIQFIFGRPILRPKKYSSCEVELSRKMIDIWSNFIKFGKPNVPWPLYSSENRTFKVIGPNYVTGKDGASGPDSKNCEFLRPFYDGN